MVSNMTVGDLKELLNKFDDNLDVVCCGVDMIPFDISSVKFSSYDPEGLVENNHIDGSVLCVCFNLESVKVGV